MLPAVGNVLLEQSVIVADAVTVGRDTQCRQAVHEAGGKPSQTAVAERSVGFQRADVVEVDPEIGQRLPDGRRHGEIAQRIEQKPADEELDRQEIDALRALRVHAAGRRHPLVDNVVAQRKGGGHEPVA
jgi:hypothetical protein